MDLIKILKERFNQIRRERLFKFVYKKSLLNDQDIFEIGSNDGDEIDIAVKSGFKNKIYVFEPNINNFNFLKKKFFNFKNIKIFNIAVGSENTVDFFYNNKKFNNLNTSSKPKSLFNYKKSKIKYVTLKSILEKYSLQKNILIKMDIEGAEYDVLLGGLDSLIKRKNIKILLELHPLQYSLQKRIDKIFKKLFISGFKPIYVESAGVTLPKLFHINNYFPFKTSNNRGLYKNISSKFILTHAFKLNFHMIKKQRIFGNKIIRSILISK